MRNHFPVIINNRDRLEAPKAMVEALLWRNTEQIWIYDNASTYEPLLEWYDEIDGDVNVVRGHNAGYLALFNTGLIDKIPGEWLCYTDPDIELNPNMPHNYQEQMLAVAEEYKIDKVGLALRVDDLPDHYPYKGNVLRNEDRHWHKEVGPNLFEAHTDTTFHLTKRVDQFESIRMAGDFACKHLPWYYDPANMPQDEQYYLDNYDNWAVTHWTRHVKYGGQ